MTEGEATTPADAIIDRLGKMLSELDEVVMTDNQRAEALIDEYERHRTTSLAAQEAASWPILDGLVDRLQDVYNKLTPGAIESADLDGMAFTVKDAIAALASIATTGCGNEVKS